MMPIIVLQQPAPLLSQEDIPYTLTGLFRTPGLNIMFFSSGHRNHRSISQPFLRPGLSV
jgi:hypothetical protein